MFLNIHVCVFKEISHISNFKISLNFKKMGKKKITSYVLYEGTMVFTSESVDFRNDVLVKGTCCML